MVREKEDGGEGWGPSFPAFIHVCLITCGACIDQIRVRERGREEHETKWEELFLLLFLAFGTLLFVL